MSYLFTDSSDVHAAASFGQEAAEAMLPSQSRASLIHERKARHRASRITRQTARRAAMLSRRAGRRGMLPTPGVSGLGATLTNPNELYRKLKSQMDEYAVRLSKIRDAATRSKLYKDELVPLLGRNSNLAQAFSGDATPGSADLRRLEIFKKHMSAFRHLVEAAEATYGTGPAYPLSPTPISTPIPASTPTPEGEKAPSEGGILGLPTPVVLIGILGLLYITSR